MSGPWGHHVAVASMGYLMYDEPNAWANSDNVWASCLLGRGGIFEDKESKNIFLSFGFKKFAAIGSPMQLFKVGEPELEYLIAAPQNSVGPEFMLNFDVTTASRWQRIVVKRLPPACMPTDFAADVGSVCQVTSREWILKAGVREGIYLTDPQIRRTCLAIGAGLPKAKAGTGSKGSVKKIDRAKCRW